MNYNVTSIYIIDWLLLVNHVKEYIEFDLIWLNEDIGVIVLFVISGHKSEVICVWCYRQKLVRQKYEKITARVEAKEVNNWPSVKFWWVFNWYHSEK